MKKGLLLFFLCTVFMAGMTQPDVYFRFANPQVIPGDPGVFTFDIEMMSNQPDTYQRDLQVYFDYSGEAFGDDIVKNNNLVIEKLMLMDGVIGDTPKYSFIKVTDVNNFHRVAILTEFTAEEVKPGPDYYNLVPEEWSGLARISIKIKSEDSKAGIKMIQELMEGGLYYTKTDSKPYKYDKLIIDNDLIKENLK
ncbi:MAG: hypothetical protein JXA03_14290 [Bacteroidales bacterium]|nr:hypothetical protein [Bacteroidales bacterium]